MDTMHDHQQRIVADIAQTLQAQVHEQRRLIAELEKRLRVAERALNDLRREFNTHEQTYGLHHN